MITGAVERIKGWIHEDRGDVFLFFSIVLISLISFGLGRLSVIWQPHAPIQVTKDGVKAAISAKKEVSAEAKGESQAQELEAISETPGSVVASKNGSSYHLPTCSGAKNIKPENIIKFNSAAEARAAGYKPAGNCPALTE